MCSFCVFFILLLLYNESAQVASVKTKNLITVQSRVLTPVTNQKINFLLKGHRYIRIKYPPHKQSEKACMYFLNETCQNSRLYGTSTTFEFKQFTHYIVLSSKLRPNWHLSNDNMTKKPQIYKNQSAKMTLYNRK